MREFGHIRLLQIQVDSLKKGDRLNRYYDTAALREVPSAKLTREGLVGLLNNQELYDIHHAEHERSKNRLGNAISFNFTYHYEQMRQRFGARLALGSAGENILIETTNGLSGDATEDASSNLLQRVLIVETEKGQCGRLTQIEVAAPCVPFCEFALMLEEKPSFETAAEALQFLDGGMRGYYCTWEGPPLTVRPGDRVYSD